MKTSGQSNLKTGRIAATHKPCNTIWQVAPVCTPLIHASLGPRQSKSQMVSRSILPFFAQLMSESHYTF